MPDKPLDVLSTEIGQHENCNLGKSPSHAVMTWADNGARANYSRLLVRASKADATSDIFNSAKYGGKDLVFKDSTKELVDAGEKELYTEFLSEQYLADVEALDNCPDPVSAASGSTPFGFFVLFLLAVFMAMWETRLNAALSWLLRVNFSDCVCVWSTYCHMSWVCQAWHVFFWDFRACNFGCSHCFGFAMVKIKNPKVLTVVLCFDKDHRRVEICLKNSSDQRESTPDTKMPKKCPEAAKSS